MTSALTSLTPITQPKSASETIAEQLRQVIASGTIGAGEKLPSENELARTFEVSRPVVREALRGLTMMGIVESRKGGGCYVTDLTAPRLMEPLSFYLSLRDYSMDEMFRARVLIDSELARGAALAVDQEQVASLKKMVRMGFELTDDPVGFRVMDAQFHALIATAGGNAFLHSVSQSLYGLAVDLRRKASEMPGVLKQSARDHEAIALAIEAGDPDAAGNAMTRHVENIRETTILAQRSERKDQPDAP